MSSIRTKLYYRLYLLSERLTKYFWDRHWDAASEDIDYLANTLGEWVVRGQSSKVIKDKAINSREQGDDTNRHDAGS